MYKRQVDTLSTNNSELAKSLYQLDVLYNTSTQLAGSLDKQKLINIMIDGLEKSLSFSLSSTLVFNDEHHIDLIINSLYAISPRLEHSLKLRAILSYRALFDKKRIPYDLNVNDITVIKNIKHPLEEYDLNILKFDNLFAPINVGEKFFGLIEVFRESDFSQEDTTCFQTLARQVSLPLENAALYEEIKKTNTKLEKLERLKSEFISIVSHELRTPLTAIKNSLEICLSGKAGDVSSIMDKFLNMAKRNVTRLSGIINDLLDLSKVEAGKMDFKFERTSINTPVEFIKNTFENVAKEKNIDLVLEKDDNIASTYIDNQRIEQVVSNLVSNAIKFTNENGRIIVKTENIKQSDIDQMCIRDRLDLDKEISKAKSCEQNVLLVALNEPAECKNSFIDAVLQEKITIIRKTSNTKEVYFEENGKKCLVFMIPEADKFAQSFIEKKIESTLCSVNAETNKEKYDILYSSVLYPDNGEDAHELMETAKDLLSKQKTEMVEA